MARPGLAAAIGLVVAAIILFLPRPAEAGGVVGFGTPGTCTQAALEARLAGGGLVTFDCGLAPVTIALTRTQIISLNTTIEGSGVITLSGGALTALFEIDDGRVSLQDLTLADGFSEGGGAIYNKAQLTVVNTNFINNQAVAIGGAIYSLKPLTITGGLFYSNSVALTSGGALFVDGLTTIAGTRFLSNTAVAGGGAVYNSQGGMLRVQTSLFQGNTTGNATGGGILNTGGLVVNESTFTGNSAIGGTGGGLAQAETGRALVMNSTFTGNVAVVGGGLVVSGSVTISNTTLSNNVAFAGGGALVQTGTLTVTNSTFADNGAVGGKAIAKVGSSIVLLKNTILAGGPTTNCVGTMTSLGHNLDDGHTCGLGASGDMTDTNPLLGPMADNGGPTQTRALLLGSPAINHGDNAGCPATDQRGYARIAGCDIGAFEYVFRVLVPMVRK